MAKIFFANVMTINFSLRSLSFGCAAALFLTSCAAAKSQEAVRIVPTTAEDGRGCYVLFDGDRATGLDCAGYPN